MGGERYSQAEKSKKKHEKHYTDFSRRRLLASGEPKKLEA